MVGEWHQSKPSFNCVLLPLHKAVPPNKQVVWDASPTIASSAQHHHHRVTLHRCVYFFLNMKIHSDGSQGQASNNLRISSARTSTHKHIHTRKHRLDNVVLLSERENHLR